MTPKSQAFELAFKHHDLESGPEVYHAWNAPQQTITRLFRQAGIKPGSSHSGRRSLAVRVIAATGDLGRFRPSWATRLEHSIPVAGIWAALIWA